MEHTHLPTSALVLLRENAEIEKKQLGLEWGYRAVASICDAALHRCQDQEQHIRMLERQLGAQERKAANALRPRTGNVIPLGSRRAPIKDLEDSYRLPPAPDGPPAS